MRIADIRDCLAEYQAWARKYADVIEESTCLHFGDRPHRVLHLYLKDKLESVEAKLKEREL